MLFKMLVALATVVMNDPSLRQEVVCAETGFSRAAEAKDAERFLSFVDPDARFVSDGVARGHREIAEAWSALLLPDGPTIRWRPAIVEVSADGRLAISRGPYRTVGLDEQGNRRESWGHFTSTWRRGEDGTWLVLFDAGGDAGMTPTDEEIAILEADPDCP
jgi:ketosteroid isomerase-like protein